MRSPFWSNRVTVGLSCPHFICSTRGNVNHASKNAASPKNKTNRPKDRENRKSLNNRTKPTKRKYSRERLISNFRLECVRLRAFCANFAYRAKPGMKTCLRWDFCPSSYSTPQCFHHQSVYFYNDAFCRNFCRSPDAVFWERLFSCRSF